MRAKRTGSFMRARRSSTVAAPAEKICSAPSKQHRMQRDTRSRALRDRLGKRHAPDDLPAAGGELADRPELLAVAQPEIAHVPVETRHLDASASAGALRHSDSTQRRPTPCARRACEPTTCNDQATPCSKRLWMAKVRSVGSIGQLQMHARDRLRQDERLANLEILDHERPPFEKLHAGLQHHFDEARRGKDDVALHLVILEKSHVPAVEPRGPGRRGAREAGLEQAAPARAEAAFAPLGGFIPPAALDPTRRPEARAGGATASSPRNRSATPRGADPSRSPAATRARARGGPRRRPVAFVPSRPPRHSWMECDERGMRADLQPDIDAEIRDRLRPPGRTARAAARRCPQCSAPHATRRRSAHR